MKLPLEFPKVTFPSKAAFQPESRWWALCASGGERPPRAGDVRGLHILWAASAASATPNQRKRPSLRRELLRAGALAWPVWLWLLQAGDARPPTVTVNLGHALQAASALYRPPLRVLPL